MRKLLHYNLSLGDKAAGAGEPVCRPQVYQSPQVRMSHSALEMGSVQAELHSVVGSSGKSQDLHAAEDTATLLMKAREEQNRVGSELNAPWGHREGNKDESPQGRAGVKG